MMIPESYYKKKLNVKLTEAEIDIIIEVLNSTRHDIYDYLDYDGLIKKLKKEKE